MSVSPQDRVDYVQHALQRVAAMTRAIIQSDTITVHGGNQSAKLPTHAITVESLSLGGVDYPELLIEDWMAAASMGTTMVGPGHVIYGGRIYVAPTPAEDTVFNVVYVARAGEIDSDENLQIDRPYQRLVEWRVLGDILRDERQDELASYYDNLYSDAEMRLRGVERSEPDGRLRVAGYDS